MRDIYSSQVKDVHKRLRHFFLLVTWALLLNLGLSNGTLCIVGATQLLGFCVCVGSRPEIDYSGSQKKVDWSLCSNFNLSLIIFFFFLGFLLLCFEFVCHTLDLVRVYDT